MVLSARADADRKPLFPQDGREKEIANNRYDKDGGNWITVKTSSAGTYILTHKDKVKEDVTKPEKPNNGSNQGEIKPTEGGQDNQPGSTPQTGDDFALLKYLLILFAAGTLLAAARKLDK